MCGGREVVWEEGASRRWWRDGDRVPEASTGKRGEDSEERRRSGEGERMARSWMAATPWRELRRTGT